MITAFGAWLLWKKAFRPFFVTEPALTLAPAGHEHHGHAHHHHAADEVCDDCGHSHAPDPALLADQFDWRTAWSAIAAVGMRPCSGALIILTFALLNGLYVGGVLSVMAMALGTAITVSSLATLAVTAKNTAVRLASSDSAALRIHRIAEIGGAALVFVLGLTLLGASLSA
jgi:nickel/cobalt transporter (NicO) family protein